jgi:tRNA(Ile)-lysidine synthase
VDTELSAFPHWARARGVSGPGDDHPFDSCFERLELSGRSHAVVALSGGSDSTALLLLFADFMRRRAPWLHISAVTVDHMLRPEAADEARRAGAFARDLGVAHKVVRWEGDKPRTGIIDAAREARHGLLAEAAREAGTDLVLVGHTLDDQAETVAMRGARGSGRGAAGMADATLYDWSVWFVRPLLGTRRSVLRAELERAGFGWIDDPSNEDARFERVRVRDKLAGDDAAIEALGAEARQAAKERMALGERAAALIGRVAAMPVPGLIQIEPAFAQEADREAAGYALRILLAVAGGQAQLPDAGRAEALMAQLSKTPFRATLSRAVVDSRRAGIFIYRERRRLPAMSNYSPGIWDGRFQLSGEGRAGLEIGVPDAATIGALAKKAPDEIPRSLARAALSGLPAHWVAGECLGIAGGTHDIRAEASVAPWARFLPSFDLAPARAGAQLVGAELPPAPPFAGHKKEEA